MGKKEVGDMSNRDRIARLEEREKVLTGRVMALEEIAPVGPRGQGGLLSGRVWVGSVLQVADEALDRIKELEAERDLLRDKIDKLEVDKASLLSKNAVGGEDVYFWHQRYWDLDRRIGRFRDGYTSFGSPERHVLDRILAGKEGK